MKPIAPQFLTVAQVCTMLNCSKATVWRWTSTGHFPPPVKLGPNTTRWRAGEVEAWLAERTTA